MEGKTGFTCPPLIPHLVREIKLKKKKINRAEEEDAEKRRGRENRVPILCSDWELYLAAAARRAMQQGGRRRGKKST